MAGTWFTKALEQIMDGTLDLGTATLKAVPLDLADVDTFVKPATSSTDATPIVMTSTAHGFTNGDLVLITGHATNTAANGLRRVANAAANTFELTDPYTGANIAGSGGGAGSGGSLVDMTNSTTGVFLADVNAGVIGTAQTLASKTFTKGVFDAADVTFTALTGDQFEAILVYYDSGVAGTSTCICIVDSGTGIPFTPSGSNLTVQWAATGIASIV